jgi:hypothetical protein
VSVQLLARAFGFLSEKALRPTANSVPSLAGGRRLEPASRLAGKPGIGGQRPMSESGSVFAIDAPDR